MSEWSRIVFHVDMDAFYASVEQRDHPELRGKPVIVGGPSNRGVVSTCSYEARVFGVKSAMPVMQARKLCPQGIFVPGRMKQYAAVSKKLMLLFSDFAPDVEPLSLDEAFLEMTGTEPLFGPPEKTARVLQKRVWDTLELHCSVGVAPNKYIAKVASDLYKPRGLTVCAPGTERTFLAPLPIERMWGVGPKTVPRFHALGLTTLGHLQSSSLPWLEERLGRSLANHVWHLANGLDVRNVQRSRTAKSIGAERTYDKDIQGRPTIEAKLLPLIDEIAASLRKKGFRSKGIRLKVKYADFTQVTRQLKLLAPAQTAHELRRALGDLLLKIDVKRPIRLVGAAAFDLIEEEAPQQMSLLDEGQVSEQVSSNEERGEDRRRHEVLEHTLDAVRQKFGSATLMRGDDLLRGGRKKRTPRFDD
ncbi:MAG: DNA polymerase IV [Deltaproteobacteria bacterium]|nr:DNA polymerase IV [Deltaproteobacteria bacterium]